MRGGMPDAFEFGRLRAVVEGFAFVFHKILTANRR
jgi:hypothetical protein